MILINRIRGWIDRHELISSSFVVSLIGLLAYLPSMRGAGFYGDDYHMVYGAFTSGAGKIFASYLVDRPGAGLTLDWLYSLFGPRIHLYQGLVVVLLIVSALVVMWIIRQFWPTQKPLSFTLAVLMVVYPGFTNAMESFNYSLMLLVIFLYFISILLTVKVLQSTRSLARVVFTIVSVLMAVWAVFNIEYYLGLEILRLGVIYLILDGRNQNPKKKPKLILSTISNYLPYLFSSAAFFIWRFFFFANVRKATDLNYFLGQFQDATFYKLMTLLSGLFNNLIKITILAWFEPLYRAMNTLRLKDYLFCAILGLVGALLVYFLLRSRKSLDNKDSHNKKETIQAILFGFIIVLGTSLPIVLVNREVTFTAYGRYALSGMVGGVLILAAVLHYYVKPGLRPLTLAFLVFSGIVTQLGVGKALASDWSGSKELWWQLSWRAPSLKPGTMLTGFDSDYSTPEGFNFWGPANMIYYPEEANPVITAETLTTDLIKTVQMDRDPQRDFRTYPLNMETSKLLVLSVPSNVSCLHLINGAAPDFSIYDNAAIQLISPYSKLDQIDLTAAPSAPPVIVFGEEPSRGWCYTYQKAELALQMGEYQAVMELWAEANEKGLRPNDQVELLPFVLAGAELGNQDTLRDLLPMFFDNAWHKLNFCNNVLNKGYPISLSAHQLLHEMACSN